MTPLRNVLTFCLPILNAIYISFSGGKDSGVLLNLMIDYMRANGITRKVGMG